jgi:hypothetical protein
MSGRPDGEQVAARAYPDEPAPSPSSRPAAPDADDPPRADEPARADEPGRSPDVTVELTDRPETTVRDIDPPTSSQPRLEEAPAGTSKGVGENPWYQPPAHAPQPTSEVAPNEPDDVPDDEPSHAEQPDDEDEPKAGASSGPDPSTGPPTTGGVPISPLEGGWERVRRRHRRQTLTFLAGLILVLGVGCVAWLTYSGVVPWPFGGKVNTSQTICTRSKPLPPQQITVRVYNGSNRKGLAATVSAQLKGFGFDVEETGNDPLESKLRTAIELRHGDTSDLAALTTRAYLVGKIRDVRDDRQSDTVDVVLGPSFSRVHTRREANRALAALTPYLPLTCPASVTPRSASPSR